MGLQRTGPPFHPLCSKCIKRTYVALYLPADPTSDNAEGATPGATLGRLWRGRHHLRRLVRGNSRRHSSRLSSTASLATAAAVVSMSSSSSTLSEAAAAVERTLLEETPSRATPYSVDCTRHHDAIRISTLSDPHIRPREWREPCDAFRRLRVALDWSCRLHVAWNAQQVRGRVPHARDLQDPIWCYSMLLASADTEVAHLVEAYVGAQNWPATSTRAA